MPEHEDLHLLSPVTARKQDRELKDTAEDEVWDRPGHEQRGCPLHEHARAMNPQLNSADPGFRTPHAAHSQCWWPFRLGCVSSVMDFKILLAVTLAMWWSRASALALGSRPAATAALAVRSALR